MPVSYILILLTVQYIISASHLEALLEAIPPAGPPVAAPPAEAILVNQTQALVVVPALVVRVAAHQVLAAGAHQVQAPVEAISVAHPAPVIAVVSLKV